MASKNKNNAASEMLYNRTVASGTSRLLYLLKTYLT